MAELMRIVRVETEVPKINNPEDLAKFATERGLRNDWHEPDEQGIDAYVYGESLDNAMGSGWMPEPYMSYEGELNVVLVANTTGEPLAVVNLATLLSWGAELGRIDLGTH